MAISNRGIVYLACGLITFGAIIGLGTWAALRSYDGESEPQIEQEATVLEVTGIQTLFHRIPNHSEDLAHHKLTSDHKPRPVPDYVVSLDRFTSQLQPVPPKTLGISNPSQFSPDSESVKSEFNQRRIGLPYPTNIGPYRDSPSTPANTILTSTSSSTTPVPIPTSTSYEKTQWSSFNDTDWDREVFQVVDLLKLVSQSFTSLTVNMNQSDYYRQQVPEPTQRAYRQSWPALSYLGMGIFLLRRIHQLVGLPNPSGEARHFQSDLNPDNQQSNNEFPALDLLFLDPSNARLLLSNNETSWDERIPDMENLLDEQDSVSTSNNLARVVLNLINAYTHRDTDIMECLWSLYCEELDRSALNNDITAIVARLNSVGLDLILLRLSPAEAVTQLLQRLTSWQGLQCSQVFPNCPRVEAEQKLLQLLL